MQQFINDEKFELEEYIEDKLTDMIHIEIIEITFTNAMAFIDFRTIPINNIPYYSYKIYIWKRKDLYYIKYQEDTLIIFIENHPMVKRVDSNEIVYEIEDYDDLFIVLEDIFDTLRPKDEY